MARNFCCYRDTDMRYLKLRTNWKSPRLSNTTDACRNQISSLSGDKSCCVENNRRVGYVPKLGRDCRGKKIKFGRVDKVLAGHNLAPRQDAAFYLVVNRALCEARALRGYVNKIVTPLDHKADP